MQALQVRFSPEILCAEQQADVVWLHRRLEKRLDHRDQIRLLELVDAEARLRNNVSLEKFIAGFRLVFGIAHELGTGPPYSFRQEEEGRIDKA